MINVDRVPRKYHQETAKANQIDVVFSTAQCSMPIEVITAAGTMSTSDIWLTRSGG